ncbi:MAG: hypothetical protein GY853_13385 [PVC group bacterium]|nr:hypothetical protein [PVC group bacterium]
MASKKALRGLGAGLSAAGDIMGSYYGRQAIYGDRQTPKEKQTMGLDTAQKKSDIITTRQIGQEGRARTEADRVAAQEEQNEVYTHKMQGIGAFYDGEINADQLFKQYGIREEDLTRGKGGKPLDKWTREDHQNEALSKIVATQMWVGGKMTTKEFTRHTGLNPDDAQYTKAADSMAAGIDNMKQRMGPVRGARDIGIRQGAMNAGIPEKYPLAYSAGLQEKATGDKMAINKAQKIAEQRALTQKPQIDNSFIHPVSKERGSVESYYNTKTGWTPNLNTFVSDKPVGQLTPKEAVAHHKGQYNRNLKAIEREGNSIIALWGESDYMHKDTLDKYNKKAKEYGREIVKTVTEAQSGEMPWYRPDKDPTETFGYTLSVIDEEAETNYINSKMGEMQNPYSNAVPGGGLTEQQNNILQEFGR